jgi:hypothetical protein
LKVSVSFPIYMVCGICSAFILRFSKDAGIGSDKSLEGGTGS